jgi:hypothetical protein
MISPTNEAAAILAQLICEIRGSGHFLKYNEYAILNEWLETGVRSELIAATLLEVLTPYFAKFGPQKSLIGSRTKILERLIQLKIIHEESTTSQPPVDVGDEPG